MGTGHHGNTVTLQSPPTFPLLGAVGRYLKNDCLQF